MRIVSLVPSDTYTLIRLGGAGQLVGRTKYCVEPLGEVDSIEIVGGTKDPNIDRIIELLPDLVILNQEENTKSDARKLEAAGLCTLVTFPKRVEDSVAQVARFARLLEPLDDRKKDLVRFAYRTHREAEARRKERVPLRVFVPIWIDPWMTIHGDTYLSDQLDLAGGTNVFADRRRRYPLAADLGDHAALSPDRVGERDTRYPRVTLDEVRARAPDVILLPDEPYAFGEREAALFRALDIPAAHNNRIHCCNGRDLMWPGLRGLEGLARLTELIQRDAD